MGRKLNPKALTREVNLATQSSAVSAEQIISSMRVFKSLAAFIISCYRCSSVKQTDLILRDFDKAIDKVNHLKLLYIIRDT